MDEAKKLVAKRSERNYADCPGTYLLRTGYLQATGITTIIHALADIPGLEWIRLHYAYPSKFPMEIIDVMRERENICNYLDMPLQHASNKMLQSNEATNHEGRDGRYYRGNKI